MTQRPLLSSLVAFTLLGSVAAQANEELEFNQRQAKALNAFAEKAKKKGFPRIARVVWLQVIKLYDADNAEAWTSLGHVKIGSSWNPDPKNPYDSKETGNGADGQALKTSYESLKKDLANQHRTQAEKFAKAGREDRAKYHWGMVLRWVDGDEQAQKALAHVEVGGVTGTELEKTLYDRSKAIEKVVAEQAKTDYGIEDVDTKCQPLDVAGIAYVTVQSEHFILHGDASERDNLKEALRWAERTIAVCKVAFPWEVQFQRGQVQWAYFAAKEVYKQILTANKVPELEWKLEHSSTSGIGNTVVGATNGKQTLFDACVRNVAQGFAGFGSDGFREGIGHTFVGMIFNNNRLFSVDLKKQQGTSASEEDREFQSPDFDVWKNLNLELAWRSSGGVPANKLAFCDASNFSNEERIKAWSFSDYMMRRDPEMLRTMDQIAQELQRMRVKQPAEFEKAFTEKHQLTLAQLDKEWEDFWTGASPVLKAIQNNTPPLSAISKGVDKWLEAFNAARKLYGRTPVTYSANFSGRCKEHAEYLKKNKDLKSPADLHTQSVDLGGSYIGSLFAQMALVQTGANVANAKKVFERWIYWPGYRDALLNNTILSVGMFVEGDVLVINATSGIGEPKLANAGADCYPPRNDQQLILDGEVPVAELGPEVEALLKAHGREGKKVIGTPLTLHFGSTGGIAARGSLQCSVQTGKGEKVEGVLVFDDGVVRTTTAPGMATFWPLDPLKGKISFAWSWMGGDEQQVLRGSFNAK